MFTIKTHMGDPKGALASQTAFHCCPNPTVVEYESGVIVALESGLQIDVKFHNMAIIENMKGHTLAKLRYEYREKLEGHDKPVMVCKLPTGGEHVIPYVNSGD